MAMPSPTHSSPLLSSLHSFHSAVENRRPSDAKVLYDVMKPKGGRPGEKPQLIARACELFDMVYELGVSEDVVKSKVAVALEPYKCKAMSRQQLELLVEARVWAVQMKKNEEARERRQANKAAKAVKAVKAAVISSSSSDESCDEGRGKSKSKKRGKGKKMGKVGKKQKKVDIDDLESDDSVFSEDE